MRPYITLLLFVLISCSDDENTDLSGRYNFIEPPNPISRSNRLDNSDIAFDVIFSILGNQLTEVDLVLYGQFIDGETGTISGDQITIEGGGALIHINGVHKSGNTLQATGADFSMNSETKTFGPLQIDSY